ncbi:hypothetical protein SELMODRAFT_149865 [Selaginella moellendorffii]|uniref:RNA helicase n=1 Tax=Selaginella moellendorffii TaxID=88036 RepID=D8RTU5_SELML|nr:hypothetical protein SELMODRAFT_149865 [Selaginella moellendorffii]
MKALAAIQDGSKKAKRVIVKQRGKFDWENTEDTSQDMIPICHGQLLFGRGFYAGMDRREQKKQSAKIDRESKGQIEPKHWSEKEIHEMTSRDWRIFREDYNISYKGSRFPNPARNWEESGICPEILRAVQEAGYKKPTPIQMASIPLGLQQRDVIGIAGTGSGKTAAFVIPMLMYVSRLPKMTLERAIEGPYALVMAPTTELAQQIQEETVKLAKYMDINVLSLVAGEAIGGQSSKLLQGCEIVIATPGRLLHCLEQGYAVLHQCNYVVLDEGDRMIALGFEEQVIDALEAMPSSNMKPESEDVELEDRIYRTTYMFSATMPPAVERLAKKYLRNPVVVTIEEMSKRISQKVMMVDEEEKPKRLRRLLDELGEMSTIVFVNTKKQADKVSKQLHDMGIKVATIHGGKTQQKRQTNFQDFRSKRRSCLIATDVVGRGIDVPDVGHIVNYDMPSTVEMYIHRIGRTGRAGKSGAATTFLTLNDSEVFYDLKQLLVRTKNPVPPELARHEAAKVKVAKAATTSGAE